MSKNNDSSNEDDSKDTSPKETSAASTQSVQSTGRRDFIKYAGSGVAGFVVASVIEYPYLNNQLMQKDQEISNLNSQVGQLSSQVTNLNDQISTLQSTVSQDKTEIDNLQSANNALQTQQTSLNGFTTLGINEQKLVEALAEIIIPSETDNPGAKEAGVIYFIDKQLNGEYGRNANMYMNPPFVMGGETGPITVEGITYPQGSPSVPFPAGQKYQYNMTLREFWRYGLLALQSYANSVYNNNFEGLSDGQKTQVLTDLYNNKPTSFNDIIPKDFFSEVIFMVWSGFLMDPMYGGNQGMVGWKHVAFNGTNQGDFYGEGYNIKQLMVANSPTRLEPSSLGQYQKSIGLM